MLKALRQMAKNWSSVLNAENKTQMEFGPPREASTPVLQSLLNFYESAIIHADSRHELLTQLNEILLRLAFCLDGSF